VRRDHADRARDLVQRFVPQEGFYAITLARTLLVEAVKSELDKAADAALARVAKARRERGR
jgi:hypothetical protein